MSVQDALENLDIWANILQYFRISLQLDSDLEAKEKRKCLLRIALLSPSLTSPALDLLWQSMTSLVPVTQMINVNSELFTLFSIFDFSATQGGYWVCLTESTYTLSLRTDSSSEQTLTYPTISDQVRRRADRYLSCIHHLRLTVGPSKEMGVVSILSMALGVNPLLPRLKSLDLDLCQLDGVGTAWTYAIGNLVSPSLTSISYTAATLVHNQGITTLQSMFHLRALALRRIVYRGPLYRFILKTCRLFPNLEVLKLIHEPSGPRLPVQGVMRKFSIAFFFEQFRNLVDLEIDLRLFPRMNAAITLSPLLQALSITGNSPDIGEFLSGNIKSSSLQSLTVTMLEPPNLAWKVACDNVAASYPQVHSLSFRRDNPTPFQKMLPDDLSSLISKPTMLSLELHGISHCFTEATIYELLNSWPDLQTLSITDDYTTYVSASLLIHLSQAVHLRTIKLPLDITFLEDELSITTPLAHNRVTELTITDLKVSPSLSLERKIKVAKNLQMLFPLLERIITHSSSSSHKTYIMELDELFRSFRSSIVTYLWRTSKRRSRTKEETA
ncbi:hypothetical protein AGABI2DRAFT_120587 [Agaricus bisporus var. bisporus H97]|uniref:hypothetical protein n=1 Tax=Agaricus bisporus var. bisporus (strain H97 / ATCC MYA-4626 / FGSC 10389) TaxID=936046 RepID=UPI00029F5785|nr:hypothetical protein AGABI2DRAFT_120587 [Agaricus bisporus var. bisporus H97]EKV44459.1 hypothetical protein AGABI2DRAFT_120587 [Agaricus bisporus var. bisporus H97]